MKELSNWLQNLQKESVLAHGVRTAIFAAPDNGRPVALFVHGINGSHHGLGPLAFRSQKYRPIFVDLPGHGETEVPTGGVTSVENIQTWFQEIYELVTEKYGEISKIVAHSFGCYAVGGLDEKTQNSVVFICPVPTASKFYAFMSKWLRYVFELKFAAPIYNSKHFATFRGTMLLRNRTAENLEMVRFLSQIDSQTNFQQRRYQTRLSILCKSQNIFKNFNPRLLIIGSNDKLARERTPEKMRQIFPKSKIKIVNAGHLAPIEKAAQISDIIEL